ncbi:MAG: hypothetical protein C0631_11465 [Sedimenticola sp.]|nr:MAG: hypothetical protein C0631_11465 [Sedimenticola sp.]
MQKVPAIMLKQTIIYSALLSAAIATLGLLATPGEALADRYSSQDYDTYRDYRRDPPARSNRSRDKQRYGTQRRHRPDPPSRYRHYNPRYRYYGKPWSLSPNRHYYPRHRHYYRDNDFWGWLGFTAITLAIIDNLNESQQRQHELALRGALKAPVGETIRWNDRAASGSVTVIREGTSSEGRYCREYTQQVDIGGESQQVYGTACRNRDGSWEIMD